MKAEINGISARLLLNHVRLGHPKLFHPQDYKGDKKYRYSAEFPIELGSEHALGIADAIKQIAGEMYNDKAGVKIRELMADKGTTCYRKNLKDEDGKTMLLRCNRREADGPPIIIDGAKNPITEASGKLYGGCYVNAHVELWMQGGDYEGIRCTLLGVQFDSDGPPYGASQPSADAFETLEDDGSALDFEKLDEPEDDIFS